MNQGLKGQGGSQVKSVYPTTHPSNNLKEYLNIVRSNLLPIILIFLASVLVTVLYVMNAINIYRTTTTLKIGRPQGSILSTQLIPAFQDFQTDRYISNEIEILKSYTIREKVALTLLDSFKVNPNKSNYYYIINRNPEVKGDVVPHTTLTRILGSIVAVNQKRE
ncbi:MAG: Wzz/FepE/Etk N-terminal domain-containing protein [Ignavibacteriae bacterium]|nr:Wzz/FepE/Etk N-terminal domain-containing protein [Ignavibacteriota bacterium]